MAEANLKDRSVTLTLPDGTEREYPVGTTGMEVAESIAKSLAKDALIIEVNEEQWDLSRPIESNANIAIITRKDEKALEIIRHDCAHVLAEAVQGLFPGTQVTIGPIIENGFYYDFHREEPFSTDDFAKIEKRMAEIIAQNKPFTRRVISREEGIQHYKDKGEAFKVELVEDLPGNEDITMYDQGGWEDLCRGPHAPSTGKVGKAFKLMKLAGSYWRGDSNRDQLQRIYGTAWATQDQLDQYLMQIEEAEKRDHRKIGREMDLFHLQEEAQGSVFWHDKGWTLYQEVENYIRRRLQKEAYSEVSTPIIYDSKLWKASGHWDKFQDDMFVIEDGDDALGLKPMNCPGHVQIFNQGMKSYRDLPLRMAEFGCCHRNEAHGALHGLMRVRKMTQDDAHIFCTEDQINSETVAFCNLLQSVYKDFGFEVDEVKFADRPEVRAGSDETWDKAEAALTAAVKEAGLDYSLNPGDGAFYGPKLEFYLRDALGRQWQCGTFQMDFVLPERLGATYVGEDGERHHPVMMHRAVLGTLERFIGILIESYAGKLPLWLAPVQGVIAPITSELNDYALDVQTRLKEAGYRVNVDLRNEKINYKIREHSHAKVPLIGVVGRREQEADSVALRRLGGKDQEVMTVSSLLQTLEKEAKRP